MTEEEDTPETDDETDPITTENVGDELHNCSSPDHVSVPDIPPALTPMHHNTTMPTLFEEPSEAPVWSPAPTLPQQHQNLIEDQCLAATTTVFSGRQNGQM